MHTGDYIRSVKFDKAMGGYKVADVEMFLDEVADDVDKLIAQNRALSDRLAKAINNQEGEKPKEPAKPVVDNSDSIQNVQSILVSAQRFSDQIINEANEQAASILGEANTKAKEIDEKVNAVLAAFEKDIAERKAKADEEVNTMLRSAAAKSEGIITAAHDSVARQQLLFDKLKTEVTEFKKRLYDNHKQQLELLQKFPDTVPYDPERAAKALEFIVDSEPDFKSFLPVSSLPEQEPEVSKPQPEIVAQSAVEKETAAQHNEQEPVAQAVQQTASFVVSDDSEE